MRASWQRLDKWPPRHWPTWRDEQETGHTRLDSTKTTRKAGEAIRLMQKRGELATKGRPEQMSQPATFSLDDLGLTRSQSSRYQPEASVPAPLEIGPSKRAATGDNGRPWRKIERHHLTACK